MWDQEQPGVESDLNCQQEGTWKICWMHRWCRQTNIQEHLSLMMATRASFVEGYVFHLYPGDMWIWLYGPSELHGKQKRSQPLREMMRDEWSQQPVSQLHIFPWAPTLVWTDCRAGQSAWDSRKEIHGAIIGSMWRERESPFWKLGPDHGILGELQTETRSGGLAHWAGEADLKHDWWHIVLQLVTVFCSQSVFVLWSLLRTRTSGFQEASITKNLISSTWFPDRVKEREVGFCE